MYGNHKVDLLTQKGYLLLPVDEYQGIGRRLRQAREAAGYSQEEAGRFLGVTGATYSRYESGLYKIPIPDVYRIAGLFKVDPEYIMRGKQLSPDELPDFHLYISRKFAGNPRLRKSLELAYEAFQSIDEEREERRRQREARDQEWEEVKRRKQQAGKEEKREGGDG